MKHAWAWPRGLRLAAPLFVVSLAVAACGGEAQDPSPGTDPDEAAPDVTMGEDCEPATIRIAHALSAGSPTDEAVNRFAELVDEASGGTVEVQVFPGGQLGNEQQYLEGLASGALDMAAIVGNAYGTVLPEANILALPYAFRDYEHMKAAMEGEPGEQLVQAIQDEAGIRVLDPTWYYGTRHLTTSGVPVETPEDLQGLKIRITPVPVVQAGWAAMGAEPTPVDFAELYTALQTGIVDGQENPIPTIINAALQEVQDNLILTGHTVANMMIAVSNDAWDSLCADQQDVLSGAVEEAGDFMDETVLAAEEAGLEQLTTEGGMTLVEPDVAAFQEQVSELPQEFQGGVLADIYEQIQAVDG